MSQPTTGLKQADSPLVLDPEKFYTRQQIQELGIASWMTLRRAERAGKLKVFAYGHRMRRYLGQDILNWMSGRPLSRASAASSSK